MSDGTSTTQATTPAATAETQGEFRARMRGAFGDGRNGTLHWRDNPDAQPHIEARKAIKDQAWQAQLSTWKAQRETKKATRTAEQQARVALAKAAPTVEDALRILGIQS